MSEVKRPAAIVIQAAVDWNFLKQRPHHLAEEFTKLGLPVLFIENTGTRVPGFGDLGRLLIRLKHVILGRRVSGRDETSVEVLSPSVLPFPFLGIADAYNRRYLMRKVHKFLKRHGLTPHSVAMITYLATPLAAALSLDVHWFAAVYDVVSDPKHIEARVAASENRLLREADLVLFASETLRLTYGGIGDRFVTFRDGFSVDLLKQKRDAPEFIRGMPSPRFLYLGGLNKKVWTDALVQLADAFPAASILLVGPVSPGQFHPPRRANIHALPPVKEYRDLAGILTEVDVALIPYVPDAFVSPMYPAKVNEYLVFGLPIVATSTQELAHLAADLGPGTVYLAESAKDFPVMARQALGEDTVERQERRRELTARRTWTGQTGALLELLRSAAIGSLADADRGVP